MLSFFNRKQPEKQFLSLVISEGTVAAALWKAGGQGQTVLAHSQSVPWNSEVEQGLIDSSDEALEQLGKPANSVKEVLLGLPENWASEQSIANERKPLLKKLTKQLNLKSVGFVIVMEAIVASFRDREKTGFNALLIYVSQKTVQVLLVLHGQAQEQAKVGRSASLVQDVIEACARGNYTSLPARMLLASLDLSETQMTSERAQLQATEWKEGMFVQHPRVDVIPREMILDAVSLAGGREVAAAMGISKGGHKTNEDGETDGEDSRAEAGSSDFGFKSVGTNEAEDREDVSGEEAVEDSPSPEEDAADQDGGGEKNPSRVKRMGLIFVAVVLLLLVSLGVVYASVVSSAKAEVSVVLAAQPVSIDTNLTIDTNATESDAGENILKATQRTIDVEDTAEAVTTGTKVIGDKAKGEVTIYNLTTVGAKKFPAGTILKLDDKVQYSTDAEVTVPPRGDVSTEYAPGKTTVSVTAVNIGAESNIASNTELTVGGFDKISYVAKTNADFAGGSSRNVQVVSEADQKKITDSLIAQLEKKATDLLAEQASETEHVVPSEKVVVKKKVFSDDVGKEVKSFTLTLSITATAIVYTDQDIADFVAIKLASQIPFNATLKADRTVIEIKDQQAVSETKIAVNATISSVVIPPFNEEEIAKLLAGKTLTDARSFLDSQDAFASYEIKFRPAFIANILRKLPPAEKISIESSVQ